MLSAAAITFAEPDTYVYSPSTSGDNMSFPLERTDFLHVGTINRGGDIISVDQGSTTVSVFLNSGGTSNQFTTPVTTELSRIGGTTNKFAVADMNNDGIDDLLVLYTKMYTSGTTTNIDLVVDIYSGNRNGNFATTAVTTQIPNVFSGVTHDDFYIESFQVRNVVGSTHPDLCATLIAKSSSATVASGTFVFTGQNNGFASTPIEVSGATGEIVGFGYVAGTSNGLKLVTETVTTPENNLNVQNLQFYNATLTSTSASITAAGKQTYEAATPHASLIVNADRDAADEIVTGISYISSLTSELTYAVRITNVNSLSSGTSDISATWNLPTTAIAPRFITVGDMNNDSYPDILISDGSSYQFLRGSSSGSFTVEEKIDSYANYLATQVGDFNGDGYQDVIAIGERQVMFLPGNPSHPSYNTGKIVVTLPFKASNAIFGDFTGDEIPDFAITSASTSGGSTILVYTGIKNEAAPGSETLFKQLHVIEGVSGPVSLAVGNFITQKTSATTKVDLAVLSGNGTRIYVAAFDNGQVITLPQPTHLANAMTPAIHMAAGDFNNDGYDDIIIVNEQMAAVWVLPNKGNGDFDVSAGLNSAIYVGTAMDSTKVPPTGSRPVFVATADINDDGLLDFAVLNSGDNQIKFYTQNSSGSFTSGSTDVVACPSLLGNARNYQMIFEDFDRDGRIDLLVGVTETKQAMVFQNKGTQAGKFDSTVNWVTSSSMILDGSSGNNVLWAMSTGYVTGHKDSAGYSLQTPGVVVVSGNRVYRIANTTESDESPGIMEIVLRERLTSTTIDTGQYDAVPPKSGTEGTLTWLHEWGHYYLEVWGSSGSTSDDLTSFSCTINYDPTLFAVNPNASQSIEASSNFTLGSSPTIDVSQSTISVSGTSRSSGIGADKYVLLFRVYIFPAEGREENIGVAMPESGYPVPVDSGFSFVSSTVQVNQKNVSNQKDAEKLPVYPVIYDLNDNGRIEIYDFIPFSQNFGEYPEPNSAGAKYDFNGNGRVDIYDFIPFSQAFDISRSSTVPFPHSLMSNAPWVSAATPAVATGLIQKEYVQEEPQQAEPISIQGVTVDQILPPEMEYTAETNSELVVVSSEVDDEIETNAGSETEPDAIVAVSKNVSTVALSSSASVISTASVLSISELDTLGYSSRIESTYNAQSLESERVDYVLGELFAQEEEDDEELLLATAGTYDSSLWSDELFGDWA